MPFTASYLLARIVAVAAPLLLPVRTDLRVDGSGRGFGLTGELAHLLAQASEQAVPGTVLAPASNCLYTVRQGGRSWGSRCQALPARNW